MTAMNHSTLNYSTLSVSTLNLIATRCGLTNRTLYFHAET